MTPERSEGGRAVSVLLVDDQRAVRRETRRLLEDDGEFLVAAEAADGESALRLTRDLRPDAIVLDVVMSGMGGIETARSLGSVLPEVAIVAYSLHADPEFVDGMLRAGARAYVLKEHAREHLARAIREALAGRVFLDPCLRLPRGAHS